MKQWPVQWQSMVTRFVEKRTEMGRGEERGDLSGSSGGEFLCPKSYAQETGVPSRESSRGAEACGSIRARWRVSTLPGQLPLQAVGHGTSGKKLGAARRP